MDRGLVTPLAWVSTSHGYEVQYTMGKGIKIPWIGNQNIVESGGQNTMGRRSKYMGRWSTYHGWGINIWKLSGLALTYKFNSTRINLH
jgi:hypothetical protein